MIPQAFIDELLNRVDVVDVIEGFIKLKRSGSNLSSNCPFHDEKTPSFTVSQQKQFYHCFGCGAHGTAISFLMEYQGLGFIEAVTELANRVGLTVPDNAREKATEHRTNIEPSYGVMNRAAAHYKQKLKGSTRAVSYLKGRGITGSIAAKFVIGFSTSDWQGLREVFTDYDESGLLGQVGLIKDNDGRRYDRFRDRLMFPIRDHRGRVIAFGGRIIGEGEPKYLNSPETDLFHKGKEVYGLWESRSGIRNSKRVLVVEGYMDVVGLHQHGIDYAVATLGTATTEFQVSRLLKYAAEIIFCFDGDKAGKKAAFRALENTLGQVSDAQKVSFMFLPDGEDPDSFVRRYSKQEFEKKIVEALPMSEFLLSELSDQAGGVQTIEGKSKLAHLASAHLPAIKKAPVMRTLLRNRLVDMTGLEQGDFGEKNFENGKSVRETYSRRIATPPNRSNRTPSVINHIVEILIIYPSLATERDVNYLHSYRANLGKYVTEREVDFLHYVLTHCRNEVDRTVVLGKMRDADFKDDIDKREKLASLRYLVTATSLDNAKEEYTNAWAQLERWNRNAIADKVLKSKDLSTLSLEDREILQGLSKNRSQKSD